MALAGPIFQRAESKISAHYVHTIIIFSALHALDPNEAIMVWNCNTSAFYNSVVMFPNKFHSPRCFHFQSTRSDSHLDQKTKK